MPCYDIFTLWMMAYNAVLEFIGAVGIERHNNHKYHMSPKINIHHMSAMINI